MCLSMDSISPQSTWRFMVARRGQPSQLRATAAASLLITPVTEKNTHTGCGCICEGVPACTCTLKADEVSTLASGSHHMCKK